MPSNRSVYILALILVVMASTACINTTPAIDLKLDDDDEFSPGGRISYEFLPGNDQRRKGTLLDLVTGSTGGSDGTEEGPPRRKVQGTLSLDGEVAAVQGSDHQDVPAGEQVALGVIIPGPARIKLETNNIRGHIAARGGVRFYDILSIEAIAGFAMEQTELKIRGNGLGGRDTDTHPGFLFGGRVTVRPIPLFDLYSQYTADFISYDVETTDLQAGIELNFSRNIAVYTGYRSWTYKEESMDSGSDVDITVSGPMAGLSLRF